MEDVCLQKRWKTTTWLIYDQLLLLYVISFSSVHQITKNKAFSFISPWGTAGPEHLALQCCIKSSKHQIKNLEEIPTLQLWSLRCTGRVPSSGSQEDGIPNKSAWVGHLRAQDGRCCGLLDEVSQLNCRLGGQAGCEFRNTLWWCEKEKNTKFHKLFVLKYIFSVSDPQLFYWVESLELKGFRKNNVAFP